MNNLKSNLHNKTIVASFSNFFESFLKLTSVLTNTVKTVEHVKKIITIISLIIMIYI